MTATGTGAFSTSGGWAALARAALRPARMLAPASARVPVLYLAVLLSGCSPGGQAAAPGSELALTGPAAAEGEAREWFVDAATDTGLDFVHVNGASGRYYYPEIFAPGVALFDFDNDGDLDIYISQGGLLEPAGSDRPAPVDPARSADRLYRNDLTVGDDGSRQLRFIDVTRQSGLRPRGYGMGVAAGDVDNDGCVDLFLTRVGHDHLFRNNCDGTFTDASARSGTLGDGWAVSASFVDFDRDGWLDLYVGSYVHYTTATHVDCFSMSGRPNYCAPDAYRARPGRLFRNGRDGTFRDVTARAMAPSAFGPALGSVAADFDGDGWPDLYVANDGTPNQLWKNNGDGTFRDVALLSGTSVNADGKPEASMGLDAGDFDGDGDEDIVIANLTGEGTTLYRNDGRGIFDDIAGRIGLRGQTLRFTGFGAAWLDFDNDGWLDILTVNGAVRFLDGAGSATAPARLHQQKQLLRNLGNGRFEDVTARAGTVMGLADVGRGAAFGDVDNDGDIDVLVGNNGGPVQLLLNQAPNRTHHWLGIRATGAGGGRDMLGARIGIVRPGQPVLWRRVRSDGSYASANDPRVLVGLGPSAAVPTIRIAWPGGASEEFTVPGIDRWITLAEGAGAEGT